MRRTLAILFWAALAGLAGCNSPSVEFLEIQESAPTSRDGALEGVAFDCVVRCRSADQEQLVYRVNVLDARGRPIGSYNRLYSDPRGHVAAQRTFMVGATAVEDHRLRVTIPIEELEVTPDDLPFGALYGVYLANDECLFSVRRQVRLPARARAALQQHLDSRFSLPAPTADEGREDGRQAPGDPDAEEPPPSDPSKEQSLVPSDLLPILPVLARGS